MRWGYPCKDTNRIRLTRFILPEGSVIAYLIILQQTYTCCVKKYWGIIMDE